MPKQKEVPFETGMDEQAKQTAMSSNSEGQITNDRGNDRSSDYYETLRYQALQNKLKVESIELANSEQSLTERRNVEFATNISRLKANDHNSHGYNKLTNLDAIEAKSATEVFSGAQKEAILTFLAQIVGQNVGKTTDS